MCGVELIWRWMTRELLKSEAPASHLLHSLARRCRDRLNRHLSSAISTRPKTEKSVPQKMASTYHKSLFNPACPGIKVQEEHPPSPGCDWGHSGEVKGGATVANGHGALGSAALIFPNARMRRRLMHHILCDGTWSLNALCFHGCKSAQGLCFWWPF